MLEGYNFYSLNTRVRLVVKTPGTTVREVEANVCGDEKTPVTELVNGVIVLECKLIQDRLCLSNKDILWLRLLYCP